MFIPLSAFLGFVAGVVFCFLFVLFVGIAASE